MKNRIDSQCIHAVQISPCPLTRFARNYSFSFIRISNVCIRLLHFFHQRVRLDVPPIEFRTSPPRFSSLPTMLARPSFLLFHHSPHQLSERRFCQSKTETHRTVLEHPLVMATFRLGRGHCTPIRQRDLKVSLSFAVDSNGRPWHRRH